VSSLISRDHFRSYQGIVLRMPKRTSRAAASATRTAQVSRERRLTGAGVDMGNTPMAAVLLSFSEEVRRGLAATTTGGEPASQDECDGLFAAVHAEKSSIAPYRMQAPSRVTPVYFELIE